MTDNDWTIQVSPKLPDGSLINIRGNSVPEVLEKLALLAEKSGDLADSMHLIAGAGTAVNAGHAASQAAPAAPAQAAWTPPQGGATAAPAASQPGPVPTCDHGLERVYKTGTNAKGVWKAWMCQKPKGESCKPQWLN